MTNSEVGDAGFENTDGVGHGRTGKGRRARGQIAERYLVKRAREGNEKKKITHRFDLTRPYFGLLDVEYLSKGSGTHGSCPSSLGNQ